MDDGPAEDINIKLAINEFDKNNLKDFDAIFRHSNLLKAIDDADSSVLSNTTNIRLRKASEAKINQEVGYTVDFGNGFNNPHSGHNKDAGGITLKNLTPKSLGIDGEYGIDVFAYHAEEDYIKMKQAIFNDVMDLAQKSPDTRIAPITDKYAITYLSQQDKFYCEGKNKVELSRNDILNSVSKNAKWQRVFGDWFQANWSTKKQYAEPLYLDIAKTFEKVIENSLQDRSKLTTTLAFEDKSYFYATPKSLFFVPSVNDLDDISIKNLKYGAPDGTSQKYLAEIGMPGSIENAAIIIYIRYANGMFETNPTVRIQSLRNPEFIGWQKLV